MSNSKKTMLMLGDSLVEWGDWQELLPGLAISNRGRAGETVEELAARLGEELAQAEQPDWILIMSGTNNLVLGDQIFPAILETMLPRIRAAFPDSDIILNSMLPLAQAWVPATAVAEINRQLHQVARKTGCSFLDLVVPFNSTCSPGSPCFLPDGIHLTMHGYQVWARAIRTHLEGNVVENNSHG